MKTVKVRVNKDDIKNGVQNNGSACPIARAVHRVTGRNDIIVDGCRFFIGDVNKPTDEYFLSIRSMVAVIVFDTLKRMYPFSVEIPDRWLPKQEEKSAIIAQGEWPIDTCIKKLGLVKKEWHLACKEEAVCAQ